MLVQLLKNTKIKIMQIFWVELPSLSLKRFAVLPKIVQAVVRSRRPQDKTTQISPISWFFPALKEKTSKNTPTEFVA